MESSEALAAQFKEFLYSLRRLGYLSDTVGPVEYEDGSQHYLVRIRKGVRGRLLYYAEGTLPQVVLRLEYLLAFPRQGSLGSTPSE
jgi:hypothetical protein